jgi:sulfite oxidase
MNAFGKHQDLIIRKDDPFNAGPPLNLLRQSLITPTDLFFVRNHGTVPDIDSETYRLAITGLVEKQLSLSLEEIKQHPKATVMATLQCAGNRRQKFMAFRSINGEVTWGPEVWKMIRRATAADRMC